MADTQIWDLETQALVKIFSYLSAHDLASVSLVCQSWRDLSAEDHLWRRLFLEDWYQDQPTTHQGDNCGSYRVAYMNWAHEFTGDPCRPAVSSALNAWKPILSWMASDFPAVASSIRPGASRSQVEKAGQQLGQPLPPGLAAIYRVHDGQDLWYDTDMDRREGIPGAREALQRMEAEYKKQRQARQASARAAAAGASSSAAAVPGQKEGDGEEGEEEEGEARPPRAEHPSMWHGLFGGYAFYDHKAVTRMLPLERAVWWTTSLRGMHFLKYQPTCLVVAASYNFRKLFVVDLKTGDVFVNSSPTFIPAAPTTGAQAGQGGLPALPQRGEASRPARVSPSGAASDAGGPFAAPMPSSVLVSASAAAAAPAGPGAAQQGATGSEVAGGGGVICWFSEYGARLQAGWYRVTALNPDLPRSNAVCLFPACPPAMSVAITRGVRVTCSAVYAPEVSTTKTHMFTYSVRMRLLSVEDQVREAEAREAQGLGVGRNPLLKCQLMSRHWRIRDEGENLTDEVMGEGVIGKFPILEAGGEEFSYQSCTHQQSRMGYMEGEFRMVEGTIGHRSGQEFDVTVPRFAVRIPDYIY